MEGWFLTDTQALKSYYKQGFKEDAWPDTLNLEQRDKKFVFDALAKATRGTPKGEYDESKKNTHGPEILKALDPVKVRQASRHADRFCAVLITNLA